MCVKKANYIRIALKNQIERDEKRIENKSITPK